MLPCFQCENTSASASHCCWGLGKGKDFVQADFWGPFFFFPDVLFIWFCKGAVPSFLSLCVFLPSAAHTWVGLWLLPLLLHQAGWAASTQLSHSTASHTAIHRIPLSSELHPDEHREKVSLKIKKRPKKCLWAIAYCSQTTLGIPKFWGGCKSNSIRRAQALCSVLHVCIYWFVLAKQ